MHGTTNIKLLRTCLLGILKRDVTRLRIVICATYRGHLAWYVLHIVCYVFGKAGWGLDNFTNLSKAGQIYRPHNYNSSLCHDVPSN